MKFLMAYLILALILLLGLTTLIAFRYHPLRPLVIIIVTSVYILWGIIHHHLAGDLHRKVVLEYVSLAILGGIIISVLL